MRNTIRNTHTLLAPWTNGAMTAVEAGIGRRTIQARSEDALAENLTELWTRLRMGVTTVRAWTQRQEQRQRLAELDDRLLADIGITRAQALAEAEKPFWQN